MRLSNETVRADFLSGANGAIKIEQSDMNLLEKLYSVLTPKRPARSDEPNFAAAVKSSADIFSYIIDGRTKPFCGSTVTFEYLRTLLQSIQNCGYFDKDIMVVPEQKVSEENAYTNEGEKNIFEENASLPMKSTDLAVITTTIIKNGGSNIVAGVNAAASAGGEKQLSFLMEKTQTKEFNEAPSASLVPTPAFPSNIMPAHGQHSAQSTVAPIAIKPIVTANVPLTKQKIIAPPPISGSVVVAAPSAQQGSAPIAVIVPNNTSMIQSQQLGQTGIHAGAINISPNSAHAAQNFYKRQQQYQQFQQQQQQQLRPIHEVIGSGGNFYFLQDSELETADILMNPSTTTTSEFLPQQQQPSQQVLPARISPIRDCITPKRLDGSVNTAAVVAAMNLSTTLDQPAAFPNMVKPIFKSPGQTSNQLIRSSSQSPQSTNIPGFTAASNIGTSITQQKPQMPIMPPSSTAAIPSTDKNILLQQQLINQQQQQQQRTSPLLMQQFPHSNNQFENQLHHQMQMYSQQMFRNQIDQQFQLENSVTDDLKATLNLIQSNTTIIDDSPEHLLNDWNTISNDTTTNNAKSILDTNAWNIQNHQEDNFARVGNYRINHARSGSAGQNSGVNKYNANNTNNNNSNNNNTNNNIRNTDSAYRRSNNSYSNNNATSNAYQNGSGNNTGSNSRATDNNPTSSYFRNAERGSGGGGGGGYQQNQNNGYPRNNTGGTNNSNNNNSNNNGNGGYKFRNDINQLKNSIRGLGGNGSGHTDFRSGTNQSLSGQQSTTQRSNNTIRGSLAQQQQQQQVPPQPVARPTNSRVMLSGQNAHPPNGYGHRSQSHLHMQQQTGAGSGNV